VKSHTLTLLLLSVGCAALSQAATLGPLAVSCQGVACGNVNVATNTDAQAGAGVAGDISATFTAAPNLAAAMLQCCGHFNWMNIVISATANSTPQDPNNNANHAATPWIDPADGGSFGFGFNDPADHLPFYYDEQPVAGGGIQLAGQIAGNVLNYFDHPNNAANVTWTFETYLVLIRGNAGQTDDRHFTPLVGFTWVFTENATATGSTITGLGALPINAARITSINNALAAPQNNNFNTWSAISADQMCPEPGTVIMMFGGLALVTFRKFRRAA